MSNQANYKQNREQTQQLNSINSHGVKLDGLQTKLSSIDNRLDNSIGDINNSHEIGDGSSQLRSLCLGYDRTNGKGRSLLVDANGRLECSVDALEVTAETINLNTDTLEAKIQSVDTRLDNTMGSADNNLGTGASKLQVFPYGKDSANDIMRPIKVDAIGKVIIDSPAGSDLCLRLDSIETTNNACQVLLGTIDADTNAIKTAVELIDNCVGGNELQVDIVSGVISLPSGSATEAKQDVQETSLNAILAKNTELETLLTAIDADTNAIKTAVEILDNAISGSEIQCDIVTLPALATGSNTIGTVNLSATDNAVLDAIVAKNTQLETLLTAIDSDTNAIKTAVEILDNAISGSEIQCDIVTLPALATGSNTIGTVNLSATDNAVLDAIATDGDNVQTLLTTMDGVMDNILTKNTEIDAVLDTISGKITACNTGAVVISSGAVTASLSATDNAVLDTIDAVLDTIKVDTEAIETAVEALAGGGTTGEWLASGALADQNYSASFDASAYKDVRFFGVASATIGMSGMPLLGSQTSGGTYYALQASEKITETQTSIGGVTKYMLSAVIENTPKFLKVYNNTGGSKTFELDYVGYVN